MEDDDETATEEVCETSKPLKCELDGQKGALANLFGEREALLDDWGARRTRKDEEAEEEEEEEEGRRRRRRRNFLYIFE